MPRLRQIITLLAVFAITLGMAHFYMFTRIDYYLQLSGGWRTLAAVFMGGFAFLTWVALPASHFLPRRAATVMAWLAYPWMGMAFLLFVILMVTDVIWLLLNLLPVNPMPEKAQMLQYGFGIVSLGVAAGMGGIALWNVIRPVSIKPVAIKLQRLPTSFDGLRIVQITDIHIGPLIKGDWLRRVVDQVNSLKPDVIVITGDLVDGSVDELHTHVAPLGDLKAPYGTYFVTGNHEYYSGASQWCAYVAQLGISVLRNHRVSIDHVSGNGESFDLVGVDDWASGHFHGEGADLKKALAGRDTDKAVILLAHQPAAVTEAAQHGIDLQLSGHTHGGQIWPFTYLVKLQQPYTKGLHRHGDTATQVYISTGTGFWGPPMRLGTTAEITHITLRAGD